MFLGLPQNIHSSGDSTLILTKRCVYKLESMERCRLSLSYFPGLEDLSPTEIFCGLPTGMQRLLDKSTKAKTCYCGRPHKKRAYTSILVRSQC